MSTQSTTCAALLAELIGYRTENPTGNELALAHRLADELGSRGADSVEAVEVPRPGSSAGAYAFARFGKPELLINVHLDTVPPNTGWSRDPFAAEITGDRVYGLGSADTKGAIAAVLTALEQVTPKNVGILFSGDEERGTHCVEAFIASERIAGIERAIVCEPTARRAGVRHRGVFGYRARIRGKGGHSSKADFMPKPIVVMARLAVGLDELATSYLTTGPEDMKGLCINVAGIDGGVAFNVVPDSASLIFSVRPPPGFDSARFDGELAGLVARVDEGITLERVTDHHPFACRDVAGFHSLIGDAVSDFGSLDFWTEAALLSAAGVDAVVVGPGDIAQAHAPDEFVTLADLDWATALFCRILSSN